MATTTVSDYVIWTKHIHGDPELVSRVHDLWAGQTIELEVDGLRGTWRKMDDGSDGRPTPGLRPIGAAQVVWRTSSTNAAVARRVTIREAEPRGGVAEASEADRRIPLLFPQMAKTEEERQDGTATGS